MCVAFSPILRACYSECCQHKPVPTIIAEAVKTGAGAALIHIDFTAGASESPATLTAETQGEMVLIQLFHTHCTVLAGITGLTG